MTRRTLSVLTMAPFLFLLVFGCARLPVPEAKTAAGVSVTKLVYSTNSWDGALLPAYPRQQPGVSILRIVIPPGVRLHAHSHPVINAGVMIRGQLTVVTTNGATLHLVAGDPIVEVVNTLHYGINEGKTPAEIIVFYAGAADQPISIIADP